MLKSGRSNDDFCTAPVGVFSDGWVIVKQNPEYRLALLSGMSLRCKKTSPVKPARSDYATRGVAMLAIFNRDQATRLPVKSLNKKTTRARTNNRCRMPP